MLMYNIWSATFFIIVGSGHMAFSMKYTETQYHMSASGASMLSGKTSRRLNRFHCHSVERTRVTVDSHVRRKTSSEQNRGHVTSSKPITRFLPNRHELFRLHSTSLLGPLCLRCSAQENQSNLRTNHLKSVRMRICKRLCSTSRSKQTASLTFGRRFEIT
ncbi:unnamed protein product [Timema podura]|uniref:Secreted protein n=1 Tax=Timema podura TaxID=61482 RepID=A0ABN7PGT3_TIMPD|nr:unnamed protein product [Timema podura]